jgi:hypothetical protein
LPSVLSESPPPDPARDVPTRLRSRAPEVLLI